MATNGDLFLKSVELVDAATERIDERTRLALYIKSVILVFYAGPRTKDEIATLLDVFKQVVSGLFRQHIEAGGDDQFVLAERSVRRDDVDALRLIEQWFIESDHLCDGIEVVIVALEVDCPAAVEVVDEGDR